VNTIALLAAALAGGATLLLIIGVFGRASSQAVGRLAQYGPRTAGAVPERRGERRTLGQAVADSSALARFNQTFERRTWSEELARELARADLALKPVEYVVIRIAVIVIFVVIGAVLGATVLPVLAQPVALVLVGILGFFVPRLYIGRRQANRLAAFHSRLADTITLIANALRSGSSFLQSIELVVRENPPPVSTEFNRVIREVNLGLPLDQALNSMVRRVRSDDLELMATSIAIQHQVGGNLSEILDTIAFTIRDRVRIKGEIRTLTAQQRLSGYVVGFLPVALLAIISVIAPQFIRPMLESPPDLFGLPLGVILLATGAIFMAIGFMVIRRIVDIAV
jgi:tight adherence protein B